MTEPFPYRCEYGYMCQSRVDFATFAEALAFLRGYLENRRLYVGTQSMAGDDGLRIVNHTNIDGADDAKSWAQHGLTEDEWEQVQGVE